MLGLRPGAGRDQVDQAYRRLIKRYHPDAAGGDANRAAEINRAYSELRSRARAAVRPQPRPAAPMPRAVHSTSASKWRVPLFAAAAAAAIGVVATSATITENDGWPGVLTADSIAGLADTRRDRSAAQDLRLEIPLSTGLIESSVTNAKRLLEANDPVLAAEFSRECLNRLSAKPSVPLFDSCAAYDEAIALLSAGHPVFEAGAFNPLAVTARQVGAARLLSANDFEAESRLQQIRSRVQIVLLPGIPDSSRAPAAGSVAQVPVPRRLRVPITTRLPTRYQPQFPAMVSRAASEPLSRQIASRSAPVPRTASAAPRPSAAVVRAAEAKPKPAWQEPLKPAWQRPLR